MFFVFFYIEHYNSCDLHLLNQKEVSEDEKNLAVLLEVWAHVLLENKKVVIIFHALILPLGVLDLVISAVFSVTEGEDIVSDLEHE